MLSRRYKRRPWAASSVGDAVYIANRLSWRGAVLWGLFFFAAFYWLIPWWIAHLSESLEGNRFQSAVVLALSRRIHYSEWVGIASLVASCTVAAWKLFSGKALSRDGERHVSVWSRLVGRRLD